MIQSSPSRPRKSSFPNSRTLFGGAASLVFASLIGSWGCGEAAPFPGPAGSATGGTSTGGVDATGGTVSTGGTTDTGGTPAATGGTPAATGGTPSTGGAPAAPPDCVAAVFAAKCTSCHGMATAPFFGGLDLSGDFVPRLLDKNATYMTVVDMSACVPGTKLIDSNTPSNSWLLKKINAEQGTCGTAMPQVGVLSADEKTCLQNWVQTY